MQNSANLKVIVRERHAENSDMWDDFLDSLAVQGLEPTFVSPAANLGSKELKALAASLAEQGPNDVILFLGDP